MTVGNALVKISKRQIFKRGKPNSEN